MIDWWHLKGALRLGVLLGLIFGAVNLVFSWLYPLGDDTIAALLRFDGDVFLAGHSRHFGLSGGTDNGCRV